MSGFTAAAALQAKGCNVLVVDKGRGPGGRMATRSIGGSVFDSGAQFFTVRDVRFREAIERWEAEGAVAPWFTESGHIRYRAKSGMRQLAMHLAKPFEVKTETRIQRIEPGPEGWCAVADTGARFVAEAIVLTAPGPQAAALLAGCAEPGMMALLRGIEFDPCLALLVSLEGPGRVPAPGYVRVEQGPIEWIADNAQKGISAGGAALTIHARADFSRQYLDAPEDVVARQLLTAAGEWLGGNDNAWQLHRWRYSKPVPAERPLCLFSSSPAPLAIAGDAFAGSRLEGAFLSGVAAAEKILAAAQRP